MGCSFDPEIMSLFKGGIIIMAPLVSIYFGGTLTLLIAFYHSRLYKLLNWSEDFKKIKMTNQRILYTIHIALTLLFLIIGILSIFYAAELSESKGFAFGFNLLYACFWTWRLVWQLTYLKKGKGGRAALINARTIIPFMIAASYSLPVIASVLLK
jgi:hypothetical protein